MLLEKMFFSSFSTSPRTFSEFDVDNTSLFEIKVFSGKIDGTTARSSFT